MEHQTPSEEMPTLYRAVLDTVWRLERMGERDFALTIRRRAVDTYATRWDEGGQKELVKINRDALKHLETSRPIAGFAFEASTEAS
jgi:hypothetical protein